MALLLSYHIITNKDIPPAEYAVLFSVTALLSVVRSGVRKCVLGKMGPSQDAYPSFLPPQHHADASWPFLDHERLAVDCPRLRSPACGACSIGGR
jgi:hypothetical protein